MVAQTTYNETPAAGFAGMLNELFHPRVVDTNIAEGAVPIGQPVKKGTADAQGIVATAAGDILNGISLFASDLVNDSGTPTWSDEEAFPVLRSGRMYVTAGETVVKGDPVFAGVGGEIGEYFNDSGEVTQITDWHISTALVTSNVIALTINGLAIPGSPITFATTNAATLLAIALVLENSPLVASAVSDGVDDIVVTSAVPGLAGAITVGGVVTSGAGQATVTDVPNVAAVAATRASFDGEATFRQGAATAALVEIELT